jgi:hypothetical protein
MTSATSRRSFYPLPPSVYPQPLVDPCAAFETTYGHSHCQHAVANDEFFRARTLNPQSAARLAQTQLQPQLANAAQGIYPRHGTGQFVIPYYRRDSKGYRRPFEQPVYVDENYSATKDVSGLIASGFNWSHPSSRPKYAVSRAGEVEGAGATFSTSYRNSGLFDATSTHTSRVTNAVAQGLQFNRSQQLSSGATFAATSRLSTAPTSRGSTGAQGGRTIARNNGVAPSSRPQVPEVGYYTNDVRDQPPPGAELYVAEDYRSELDNALELDAHESNSRAQTARPIVGDPLLSDARDNAMRSRRTVYQRSFGLSQ